MTSRVLFPAEHVVPVIGRWVSERMGSGPDPARAFGPYYAVAAIEIETQKILAACVYTHFRELEFGKSLDLVFAADTPRWATRQNIGGFLHYPFRQIGVCRATAVCAKSNRRIRRFVAGIGFRLEGKHARGWDGRQAAVTYGMLPQAAEPYIQRYEAWLEHHGQEIRTSAAASA